MGVLVLPDRPSHPTEGGLVPNLESPIADQNLNPNVGRAGEVYCMLEM